MVATLTFASGLNTLVSHPALYGWNWNFAIEPEGGDNVPPVVGHLLDHDPDVAAWTGFNFADVQIDGQTVPALIDGSHASLSPPILSGHRIQAKNQIVLGAATLASLHKRIGQSVVVSYGSPEDAPIYQPPTHARRRGHGHHASHRDRRDPPPLYGHRGAVLQGPLRSCSRPGACQCRPQPQWPGDRCGADPKRCHANGGAAPRCAGSLDAADKAVANDPQAYGDSFVVLGVQRPAEIVNYQSTGASPGILAAGLAVGAVVALGLTLGASVRRRRRDIALLKTLGFTRRQLAVAVAWQASVAAIVGIVLGVPVGIAFGRWLWDLFARAIYAVPSPTVPALEVVLVALGALVVANLVAALPGQMAARTPTAVVLRAE